jgi:hypothetical protein
VETVDSAEFERIFPSPSGVSKKKSTPVPVPVTAYTPYRRR